MGPKIEPKPGFQALNDADLFQRHIFSVVSPPVAPPSFVASRPGLRNRSGNKVATERQHVASFVATPRGFEETLRGIASRLGRARLDRAENIQHEDDYGPGSIQEPEHPARNGTRSGATNRRRSPPAAGPGARHAQRLRRTYGRCRRSPPS